MTRSPQDRRLISRRALLTGGAGLLATYALGCGDDDPPSPTASPAATGTRAATSSAAAATPAAMRWRRIEASGERPSGRRDHSLVTDGRALFLFGGRTDGETLGDLWSFDLEAGTWAKLPVEGGPAARFGHNGVYHPPSEGFAIFGGQASAAFFNDLWTYSSQAGWSQPITGDSRPAQRYGAAAVLDSVGVLRVTHGFTNSGRFDDTWQYPFFAPDIGWLDFSPTGTRPVKRCLIRGAWDNLRQRFMIFGGQTDGQPFLGDLWALQGDTWTEIASEPKPSPRNFYAMAETGPGRIALFGGNTDAPGPANDLWLFDSQADTWTLAQPEGDPPSARYGHDAVWLPDTRRLIIFGGHGPTGDLNDLWELTIPA